MGLEKITSEVRNRSSNENHNKTPTIIQNKISLEKNKYTALPHIRTNSQVQTPTKMKKINLRASRDMLPNINSGIRGAKNQGKFSIDKINNKENIPYSINPNTIALIAKKRKRKNNETKFISTVFNNKEV